MNMKKNSYQGVSFLLVVLVFTSCVGPQNLQNKVNRHAYESIAVYDSKIINDKSDVKIAFNYSDSSGLPFDNKVELIDGGMVWLLLFFKYEYDMELYMGDGASNPVVTDKMEEIFNTTFERSGDFTIADSTDKADLICNITYEKIEVMAPYYRYGFGLTTFVTTSDEVDGSHSDIAVNIELKNNEKDQILMDSTFSASKDIGFNASSVKKYEVSDFAMVNLLENLTLSTQEIAKEVTTSINKEVE